MVSSYLILSAICKTYFISSQILLPSDCSHRCEIQVQSSVRQRPERKEWILIKHAEFANGALHQFLGSIRCQSVLPKQLGNVPVVPSTVFLLVHELFAIPDTKQFTAFCFGVLGSQTKRLARVLQNGVDFDKYACPKLDRLEWVPKCIDGG